MKLVDLNSKPTWLEVYTKADVDCEKQFIAVPDYALVAGKRRIRLRTDLEHETAVMSLFFTKISTATGQSRQADR